MAGPKSAYSTKEETSMLTVSLRKWWFHVLSKCKKNQIKASVSLFILRMLTCLITVQ